MTPVKGDRAVKSPHQMSNVQQKDLRVGESQQKRCCVRQCDCGVDTIIKGIKAGKSTQHKVDGQVDGGVYDKIEWQW